MIIKRKKNKDTDKKPVETKIEEPKKEPVIDKKHNREKENKNINIYDGLDFSKIDFESREERRRGERRRGYRRVDERNLVSRAQEEAQNIKKQAYETGYSDGILQFKNDLMAFKTGIESFFGAKDLAYNDLSNDVLSISIEIAKKIIKTEVSQNREILLNIVNEVLKELGDDEKKITLIVSSIDYEYAKSSLEKIVERAKIDAKINIISEDNVDEGSVIVKTSNGIIDASFTSQIKLIEEAFKLI